MLTYRQNIDAEKRQENRLQELAQLDEMTGLLTKTATRRHIEHLLKEKPDQLYAFFILDIDTFKQANDLYGHAFGDSVIEKFAAVLRAQFPRTGYHRPGSAAMNSRSSFQRRISPG